MRRLFPTCRFNDVFPPSAFHVVQDRSGPATSPGRTRRDTVVFSDFHRPRVRRKLGGRFVACFAYPWEDLEIRFDRVRSVRLCFGTMSTFVNGMYLTSFYDRGP